MKQECRVSTTSASSTVACSLPVWVRWFFSLENRYLAPMFITCILPQHSRRLASWKAIRGPCSLLSLLSSQNSWWGGCSGDGGQI